MLTGKALFNTLVVELNDMGLPGMSATLDEMYRSPDFIHLDPLMAIANLVEPEYQKKINKRIQSRLRAAHLRGCPQELSSCVDSARLHSHADSVRPKGRHKAFYDSTRAGSAKRRCQQSAMIILENKGGNPEELPPMLDGTMILACFRPYASWWRRGWRPRGASPSLDCALRPPLSPGRRVWRVLCSSRSPFSRLLPEP